MKCIGVITSGGDAPGMNAALRAVVRTALSRGTRVIGFRHGYQGLIGDEHEELSSMSVGGIIDRGGTILRTARCIDFLSEESRKTAIGVLSNLSCEGLVVIGGDGSLAGALKLHKEFGFSVMGVPASIDNDINGTDYSIGFDTAVNTAISAIDKVRDTAYSHERVFVIEVMGRRNGFIALEAGLGGGAEAVLLPEVNKVEELDRTLDGICDDLLMAAEKGKRSSIIVMAEGVPRTSVDIRNTIEEKTGFECRHVVLGHMQRGGSPSGFDRVLALRLGSNAANRLIVGFKGEMVGLVGSKEVAQPLEFVVDPANPRPIDPDKLHLARVMAQ